MNRSSPTRPNARLTVATACHSYEESQLFAVDTAVDPLQILGLFYGRVVLHFEIARSRRGRPAYGRRWQPKNLRGRDPFPPFGSSLVYPKLQGDMSCPTNPL